jgi:hypothetical protein
MGGRPPVDRPIPNPVDPGAGLWPLRFGSPETYQLLSETGQGDFQ